jgi:hypothetical protein
MGYRLMATPTGGEHWTLGLRPALASPWRRFCHISEHGIAQPHVVEAIVNHVSGVKAGVAGSTIEPPTPHKSVRRWSCGASTWLPWWPAASRV